MSQNESFSSKKERKKSIKLSLFFFSRELFVNSIQNNPMIYIYKKGDVPQRR